MIIEVIFNPGHSMNVSSRGNVNKWRTVAYYPSTEKRGMVRLANGQNCESCDWLQQKSPNGGILKICTESRTVYQGFILWTVQWATQE